MLIRFITDHIDKDSQVEEGIFHAAYRLLDSDTLPDHEHDELRALLDWFKHNLPHPTRFTSAKPPYTARRADAISWLKSSARRHVSRLHELAAFLARHDVHTHQLRTRRPGYVVYEDEFQVVAAPFAERD
jgi:hypothetical protein